MDRICLEGLKEEQRELAELIGIDKYKRLVEIYGGCLIYIPKPDGFLRASRNERIRKRFNGYNHRELAIEFGLSEQMIRNVVTDIDKEIRTRPMDGQIRFF